ncbi:MAG: hypothetical protein ACREK6_00160 [Candidatus Rokuibacteriota bacterium]
MTANPKAEIDLTAGRQAIEELAAKPLSAWSAEFLDYAGVDLDPRSKDRERMPQVRADLVHGLEADLGLLELAVEDRRRDVWVGKIGGKSVLLTGGLSWGDVPTDAFEAFNRLALAGVTRAMGFDW